jgi:putative hydrolase of the HAD superfamily
MIEHIIFDVDKTIYPESCGFGDEMDRRINEFTANFLNIPLEKADSLRKSTIKKYGTTMRWLQTEHNLVDTERYLDYVHPKNVHDYLPHKNEIKEMFHAIKLPFSILSNGTIENINRIINFYGIENLFNPVISIRDNNLVGKPDPSFYNILLSKINIEPKKILLVDDAEQNLVPFSHLGGYVLHVNEKNAPTKDKFDTITNILHLRAYLKNRFNIV